MPFFETVDHPLTLLKPGESCIHYSADKHSAVAWVITLVRRETGHSVTRMERLGKHLGGYKSSEANYQKLRTKALKAAQELDIPVSWAR